MSPVRKQLAWLFLAVITILLAGAITIIWPGDVSTSLECLIIVIVEVVSLNNICVISQKEQLRQMMGRAGYGD